MITELTVIIYIAYNSASERSDIQNSDRNNVRDFW